jgi:uncharacterized protein (DUF4415 family)
MALGRPPTGKPRKQLVAARIDPDVLAAARDLSGDNFSKTMEEALKLWVIAHAPKPKRKARRKVPA